MRSLRHREGSGGLSLEEGAAMAINLVVLHRQNGHSLHEWSPGMSLKPSSLVNEAEGNEPTGDRFVINVIDKATLQVYFEELGVSSDCERLAPSSDHWSSFLSGRASLATPLGRAFDVTNKATECGFPHASETTQLFAFEMPSCTDPEELLNVNYYNFFVDSIKKTTWRDLVSQQDEAKAMEAATFAFHACAGGDLKFTLLPEFCPCNKGTCGRTRSPSTGENVPYSPPSA